MQTDLITKVYFNEHLTHSCVGMPQGLQALLSSYNSHSDPLFKKTNILKLDNLNELSVSKYMYALNSGTLPINLANAFSQNRDVHRYNTKIQLNPHI